jgi:hypothetical protein
VTPQSPMTGEPLAHRLCFPNKHLRAIIVARYPSIGPLAQAQVRASTLTRARLREKSAQAGELSEAPHALRSRRRETEPSLKGSRRRKKPSPSRVGKDKD